MQLNNGKADCCVLAINETGTLPQLHCIFCFLLKMYSFDVPKYLQMQFMLFVQVLHCIKLVCTVLVPTMFLWLNFFGKISRQWIFCVHPI